MSTPLPVRSRTYGMGGDHRTRSSWSGRLPGAAVVRTTSAGPCSPDYVVDLLESLPRRGPDSRVRTVRALALCEQQPPEPRLVDPGGGAGVRTVETAELTRDAVLAVATQADPSVRLWRYERRGRACPTGSGASLPR